MIYIVIISFIILLIFFFLYQLKNGLKNGLNDESYLQSFVFAVISRRVGLTRIRRKYIKNNTYRVNKENSQVIRDFCDRDNCKLTLVTNEIVMKVL